MAEQKLDVLLVAGHFQVRGSSVQTLNLARRLPQAGFETRIVCPDASLLPAVQRAQLSVTELRTLDVPVLGRYMRRAFLNDLRKAPPALIHVQQRSALPLGQWLAQRIERPLVLSVQDYLGARESLLFDLQWGRRIIAVSESVRQDLLQRTTLSEELLTVIPNGVEVPPDDELRIPFSPDQTPVVGTAGPLEAAKGLRFFLRAIPQVLATHHPVEFLIAGAGPEEGSLRRLADDLGITEFITFVPNVFDLSTSLNAMDVYCLPSLKQGLGTIMLEAMARGKPVIASKVGGVYSLIDEGATGLFVPPSDSEALADAIINLLNEPQRARQIGAAAREKVRREFQIGPTVEKTAAVYREVLASAPAVLSPASLPH